MTSAAGITIEDHAKNPNGPMTFHGNLFDVNGAASHLLNKRQNDDDVAVHHHSQGAKFSGGKDLAKEDYQVTLQRLKKILCQFFQV